SGHPRLVASFPTRRSSDLRELMRGGGQQMLSRDLARRHRQRHDVLELVAESVSAAGLVEGRACPDAARERLVEQPSVEEDVEGRSEEHTSELQSRVDLVCR